MKRSLFMLGVAVAALSSCSNNEVLDIAESNAIKFSNTFVGKPTRSVTAPELTTDNLKEMYVFASKDGVDVFDANPKLVYRIGETNEWGYDKLVAWEADKNYNFVAYAGKNLGESVKANTDNKSLKFSGIVVNGDKDNQFDLLYSNTVERSPATADGNPTIDFTFNHLLSMVQFTLKSGFGATTEVKITNFKFYGVKTTGSYDASQESPAWTSSVANNGSDTDFKSDGEETAQYDKTTPTDVVNSWVVIPQKNTDSENVEMVTFTVNVVDGESNTQIGTEKIFKAKIPSITWEKGYRYNYIFTITPEQMGVAGQYITFDAPEVTEWKDDTDLIIDENNSSTSGVEFE